LQWSHGVSPQGTGFAWLPDYSQTAPGLSPNPTLVAPTAPGLSSTPLSVSPGHPTLQWHSPEIAQTEQTAAGDLSNLAMLSQDSLSAVKTLTPLDSNEATGVAIVDAAVGFGATILANQPSDPGQGGNSQGGSGSSSDDPASVKSVREAVAADVANPPTSALANQDTDAFIRLSDANNLPAHVQVPANDGTDLGLFNTNIAIAKNKLADIKAQLAAAAQQIDALSPGARVNIDDQDIAAIEQNVTDYYGALLAATDAWVRGRLSGSLLKELRGLPVTPQGLPLTAGQLKQLAISFRAVAALSNERTAFWETTSRVFEIGETVGTIAGYASGAAALGQLGLQVGKQLLKEGIKKAAWTVVKTTAVIGGTIAGQKAVEQGARALGASEETIRGIGLATMVVGVILTHRRASLQAEAEDIATNPGTDEIPPQTPGPETPPAAPPGGSGLPASVPKNNLVGLEVEDTVLEVQDKLRGIRDTAVTSVKNGTGLARNEAWSTRLRGMSPTNKDYARTFGNALHEEAEAVITAEQRAGNLPPNLVVNRGAAGINPDLPNGYNGLRPDVRLPLGNGREAVWDITTKTGAGALKGHVAKYANFDFVDYAADLPYEK